MSVDSLAATEVYSFPSYGQSCRYSLGNAGSAILPNSPHGFVCLLPLTDIEAIFIFYNNSPLLVTWILTKDSVLFWSKPLW